MSLMKTIAKWTQPNFKSIAKNTGIAQFITIPYSHYVELARWSLQLQGKPFQESGYAPGQHVLPVIATRLGSGRHLSSSSYVEKVRSSDNLPKTIDPAREIKKGTQARSTAVPVLVLPDQRILTDSWEIATIGAGFASMDPDRQNLFDRELGPTARQWAYAQVLKERNKNILNEMCTINTGFWWPIVWFFVKSFLHKLLCKIFQPFNTKTNQECREKLETILSKTDAIVRAKKGKYLNGDEITLDDVALSALGAVLVFPPEFAAGQYSHLFDGMNVQDPECALERDHWRATETGKYIMQFYAENRGKVIAKV